VAECAGVHSAEVGLNQGRVTVTGQDIDVTQLINTVVELGYTAELRERESSENP